MLGVLNSRCLKLHICMWHGYYYLFIFFERWVTTSCPLFTWLTLPRLHVQVRIKATTWKTLKNICGLPSALAIKPSFKSCYNFDNFELDVEWLRRFGILVGADNWQLEACQWFSIRAYGSIEFKEQGPPVEVLVNVLKQYTKGFPNNILLLVEKLVVQVFRLN